MSCIIKTHIPTCYVCITDKNPRVPHTEAISWFCKALNFAAKRKTKLCVFLSISLLWGLLLQGLAARGRPPRGAWSLRAGPNDTLLGDKAVGTLTPSLYKRLLNRHFFLFSPLIFKGIPDQTHSARWPLQSADLLLTGRPINSLRKVQCIGLFKFKLWFELKNKTFNHPEHNWTKITALTLPIQ